MSYILDALKKLENEKAKKSRNDGVVNISGALLREAPQRPRSGTAWKVAAVVVLASLVTFGTTWFVLKADKKRERPKPAPVAQTPPVVAQVAPPVVPPPAAPVPQPLPVPPQTAPAAPPAPASKPQATAAPAPEDVNDDAPARKRAVRPKKQGKREVRPVDVERPVTQTVVPPPADIKVSGIAWQDERGLRRAVVNGFLLREGGIVSGAKITEILKDRVRFSSGDRVFEAPLLMSVSPGAGK